MNHVDREPIVPNLGKKVFEPNIDLKDDLVIEDGSIRLSNGLRIKVKSIKVDGRSLNLKDYASYDETVQQEMLNEIKNLADRLLISQDTSHKISLKGNTLTYSPEKMEAITFNDDSLEKTVKSINERHVYEVTKNSFKPHLPGFFKKTVVKLAALIVSIVAIPFYILGRLFVGIYQTFFATYERNLPIAREFAKNGEEKNKFDQLRDVYHSFVKNDDLIENVKNQNQIGLTAISTYQNKVSRHLLRIMANHKVAIDIDIIKRVKTTLKALDRNDFKTVGTLKNEIISLLPEMDGFLSDEQVSLILHELKGALATDAEVLADIDKLKNLIASLSSDPADYVLANRLVIEQLRELIKSKTYLTLKEDVNNHYVKLIHKFSSAIWNDVKVMSEYQKFGQALLSSEDISDEKTDREILEISHGRTSKEFDSDQGIFGKAFYGVKNVKQMIASAASEGGIAREAVGAIPFIGDAVYDSHGKLSNNPFLQGTTYTNIKTEFGAFEAKINNCYGGSPTIHDAIAPEFEALCQGAENNQFASEKSYDPTLPVMVYDTNLQNGETTHAEGERSFAIMQMNSRYPLSFYGMTLAKDSKFYKMGGKYSKGIWRGVENVKWMSPAAFGEELKSAFTKEKCFQYGKRNEGETANGIYLPGTKKEWEAILDQIIRQANLRLSHHQDEVTGVDAAKLRGAYQEYVYTMIQSYTEIKLAKELFLRTGKRDLLVTAIRACKENIDRGGAENAKYLYTRLPVDKYTRQERMKLVAAALELRALLARNRKVIENRIPQVLSFIEHFTPQEIQEDELIILENLGIICNKEFHPALDQALEREVI